MLLYTQNYTHTHTHSYFEASSEQLFEFRFKHLGLKLIFYFNIDIQFLNFKKKTKYTNIVVTVVKKKRKKSDFMASGVDTSSWDQFSNSCTSFLLELSRVNWIRDLTATPREKKLSPVVVKIPITKLIFLSPSNAMSACAARVRVSSLLDLTEAQTPIPRTNR